MPEFADTNQKAFLVSNLIDVVQSFPSLIRPLILDVAQGISVGGNLCQKLLNVLVDSIDSENVVSLVTLITLKKFEFS